MLFCCFDAILGGIHRELLFLVKKVTISEKKLEILKKFVFLTIFERDISREKLGFS